jgi:hypothetical protein
MGSAFVVALLPNLQTIRRRSDAVFLTLRANDPECRELRSSGRSEVSRAMPRAPIPNSGR